VFEAYPLIFAEKRGLTIPQTGLVFIGVGIGAVLAIIVNWYFLRPYPQLIKEWRGFPPPEKRLPPSMIAGPALVIGTLWLGWTGNYASIPWYVPAMGSILVGMSIILIFISFLVSRAACVRAHTLCAYCGTRSDILIYYEGIRR
jgi:DHA1 family multidrug resistance protein-like MFS transporter